MILPKCLNLLGKNWVSSVLLINNILLDNAKLNLGRKKHISTACLSQRDEYGDS